MQADNVYYLRQETRMFVDERTDPKEIFDKDYFAFAAEALNVNPYESYSSSDLATKTIKHNPDNFIFKVTREPSDSSKIRISDIHGLFYSTNRGEIKYIENPEKGKK